MTESFHSLKCPVYAGPLLSPPLECSPREDRDLWILSTVLSPAPDTSLALNGWVKSEGLGWVPFSHVAGCPRKGLRAGKEAPRCHRAPAVLLGFGLVLMLPKWLLLPRALCLHSGQEWGS